MLSLLAVVCRHSEMSSVNSLTLLQETTSNWEAIVYTPRQVPASLKMLRNLFTAQRWDP